LHGTAGIIKFNRFFCASFISCFNFYEINNLKKRPKVGIITGWSGKLEPVDGKEFKVDFYLKKPFKLSELTKQINIAFDAD